MPCATFARRLNALTVDFVLSVAVVLTLIMLAGRVQGSVAARVFLFGILWGWALLYDPICVWRFGATVGHSVFNLQVCDARSGARLGLVRAFWRFAMKGLLGWLSFLTMAFSRRRQAVHDMASGSVVRIRDIDKAKPWHYVWGS